MLTIENIPSLAKLGQPMPYPLYGSLRSKIDDFPGMLVYDAVNLSKGDEIYMFQTDISEKHAMFAATTCLK